MQFAQRMNVRPVVLFASLGLLAGAQASAEAQRALLIGINTYQPAGTAADHPAGCAYGRCELGAFENLDGAVNDAQAMADALTGPKFGFRPDRVVLLTNPAPPSPRPGVLVLPATETSRDGILAAMERYLVEVPQKGDTVVLYVASHGSLRVNSKGSKLTVLVNGTYVHADSTLVPADAYKGGYDIRDREMTRIFNAALDKGIRLTVIFDSCHSGGVSRGIGVKYRERSLAFDPRDIGEGPELLPDGRPQTPPTEREENPALVFSAAQQDQTAKELPPGSPTGEPHGAFTAALLEALQALPADSPASLVYQRVRAVLEGGDVPDQEPDLDGTATRRQQPLFGGTARDPGKVRSAAVRTDVDGKVWLDVGRVAGIGIGSEFTSVIPIGRGQVVRLRVTDLQGIARSTAEVVSPPGVKVAPGEVFELTKWAPADSAPLRVWHWPSNLSREEIRAAAAQIGAAGAATVSDPAEEPWTHVLSWNGTSWTLEPAGRSSPVSLGAPLTAGALTQRLPAGARLWVNLPPPRELAAALDGADRHGTVESAADLAGAHYALGGTLTADGPAYAWVNKSALVGGPPAPADHGHSPGCSATSQYPARSDWVAATGAGGLEAESAALAGFASRLSKVHGWLELADSPAGAATSDYYSLAVIPASADAPLAPDTPVHEGDLVRLALRSAERVVEKRWVYVLDIDCHGKGTLLYPANNAENQFPSAADTGRQFVLPGSPTLRIGPPYGVDTLILLSTSQPLSDPFVLNFEGVASRGTRGSDSPLERLLGATSGGTRGVSAEVPTNWGLSFITLRSLPKDRNE